MNKADSIGMFEEEIVPSNDRWISNSIVVHLLKDSCDTSDNIDDDEAIPLSNSDEIYDDIMVTVSRRRTNRNSRDKSHMKDGEGGSMKSLELIN